MGGRGSHRSPLLAIVGEAPGELEDMRGEPFVGPSGSILQNLLKELSIREEDVWITNAVRCRPPGNKITDKALKACREFLHDELRLVKPKVILALGNSPLFALTGKRGIMSERGRVSEWEGIPVMPSYHPAYILRNESALNALIDDTVKAWGLAQTGVIPEPEPVNYKVVRTMDDLELMLHDLLHAPRISWDIETTSLDAFAHQASVVCVTFSGAPFTGWLLPFNHDECRNGTVQLSDNDRMSVLRELLEADGPPLVGQNLKFDMGYVRANLGINPRSPAFDAYIAHHLLYEEASQSGGNGLKAMAWKYTDRGGYERAVERMYGGKKEWYRHMTEIPLDPVPGQDPEACLKHYACADVDVVLRIQDALEPLIDEEGLRGVLRKELKKQDLLVNMETRGAAIDWSYHGEMLDAFPAQIQRIADKLREYPEVLQTEELYPKKRAKLKRKGGLVEQAVEPFNANSHDQVRLLCFTVLGLPPNEDFITDEGEYSTRREVIEGWLSSLPKKCPSRDIVELIVRGKRTAKLYGTYVKPLAEYAGRDGRIHTRYNHGRVVTGRLSSEAPNLQQLPRDDEQLEPGWVGKGSIKRLYIGGEPGWWVAEPDYNQIELVVGAFISQDQIMLDNYFRGEDLHSRTAAQAFMGIPYEEFLLRRKGGDQAVERARSAAKIINFGIIYGMGVSALATKLGVTERKAAQYLDRHSSTYTGLTEWTKATRMAALERGYVTGLFGHRRHLPNVWASSKQVREHALRQATNFPIQNTASVMTAYAEVMIDQLFQDEGMRSYCFGQVHDSLWITGPPEERERAAWIIKYVMENPQFKFLNGLPQEGMRVELGKPVRVPPLKAEVKIGMNLRDLVKV